MSHCLDAHSQMLWDTANKWAGLIYGSTTVTENLLRVLAGQVNNLLGYWNLDIVQLKLKDGLDNRARIVEAGGIEQYDVVFCMAVVNYFGGYDAWIADLCRGVLYLEGHGGEAPERYWAALNRDFERVEFLGMTDDNYVRPLFRCWK